MRRTQYITSGEEDQQLEMDICQALVGNGFPREKLIQWMHHEKSRMTSAREPEEQLALCTLPYISGLSESVQRILHPLGIRTVCRSDSWKWQLMGAAKDGIDRRDVVGVIYKTSCESCPKVYIGETGRTARVRAKEHKSLACNGHPERSAVAAHAWDGHTINWQADVVCQEKNLIKRKVKESMIIRQNDTMNFDMGCKLSKLWLNLC